MVTAAYALTPIYKYSIREMWKIVIHIRFLAAIGMDKKWVPKQPIIIFCHFLCAFSIHKHYATTDVVHISQRIVFGYIKVKKGMDENQNRFYYLILNIDRFHQI